MKEKSMIPAKIAWIPILRHCFPLVVLLAACAPSVPPDLPSLSSSPPASPTVYTVRAGDVLAIKFFYLPEFNDEYLVPPDGRITLPSGETVRVLGQTVEEIQEQVEQVMAQRLAYPKAAVILRKTSPMRVYVGGEVRRPGVLETADKVSVVDAVLLAGGSQPTADLRQVLVISRGDQGRPLYRLFNMQDLLQAGEDASLPALQPYDIVYVPKTPIAKVAQFVEQYIRNLTPVVLSAGFSYTIDDIK